MGMHVHRGDTHAGQHPDLMAHTHIPASTTILFVTGQQIDSRVCVCAARVQLYKMVSDQCNVWIGSSL
jgi:hypothetical protein